jgi:hypothetical protein
MLLVLTGWMPGHALALSFGDALKEIGKQALNDLAESGKASNGSPPGAAPVDASTPTSGQATKAAASVPASTTARSTPVDAWTDPKTRLMWTVCYMSERLGEEGCQPIDEKKGTYSATWWDAALEADRAELGGYSDWRLPTLAEVTGLFSNCPPGRDDGWSSEYLEIKTTAGVVRVLASCPVYGGPVPKAQAIKIEMEQLNRFWTSSAIAGDDGSLQPHFYTWKGYSGNLSVEVMKVGEMNIDTANVLLVRGGNGAEFSKLLVSAAEAKAANEKKQVADQAAAKKEREAYYEYQRKRDEAQRKAVEANVKRVQEFRAAVKPGDSAVVYSRGTMRRGPVLTVKGDLVQLQLYEPNEVLWFKRSQIAP